jgi:DNA-binding CsgD family transcriptional regulator
LALVVPRAAIVDRATIAVAAASVALGGTLLVVPALEPWRERAGWVIAWGAVVCLASVLIAAWSTPRPHPEPSPQPAPEAGPQPEPQPEPPPVRPLTPADAGPFPNGLSAREVEVLRLLAAGNTNRQIAAALVVSVATAERHIANIYAKIGARGRADATAYALRHGLAD